MIKKTKILIGILALVVISFVFSTSSVFAYNIETLPVEARNDFVLEPGKVEVFLEPGETATRNIYVTSRVKKTIKFKIETEDFVGSNEPDKSVVLLGKDKSPYSFKDAILPEVREFTLSFGQKVTIPVKIKIPQNAQPGGFYSAVIISNQPEQEKGGTNVGGAINVSRLGALFFIRVKGDVKEEGQLEDVRLAGPSKMFYDKGPISFNVLFNNKGTVHLVPYGKIDITNFGGSTVGVIPIDGYFALPKSLRYREVTWYSDFLFGRYKATVELNRGYKNGADVLDTQSVAFWVLPWKFLLSAFAIIFILTSIFYYIRRNFEFKKK
jgi:hypothetical protein